MENAAKVRPQSKLTAEQQQQLVELVAAIGDDWEQVAEKMELKNRREAIVEFMRAPC